MRLGRLAQIVLAYRRYTGYTYLSIFYCVYIILPMVCLRLNSIIYNFTYYVSYIYDYDGGYSINVQRLYRKKTLKHHAMLAKTPDLDKLNENGQTP